MKKLLTIVVLMLAIAPVANADIWKWVDANGNVHFVASDSPIYTWTDEFGNIHYSDTPGHEDAVSVELVWVSSGTLDDEPAAADGKKDDSGWAFDGETPEQRAERETAEAYYCKRATEIYDSYVSAPRLYETDANGERRYLDDKESAALIEDTRNKKDEICG